MILVYILFHFIFRETSLWRVDATPIQTISSNTSYTLPISLSSLNSTYNDPAPLCNCNKRSILDITWSCLMTIFLCTWVSIHPDVPDRYEKNWKIIRRKLTSMYWTIMFPEFVLAQAVRQFWAARHLFNKYKAPDRKWTMWHAHFLRMGGFYVEGQGKISVINSVLDLLDSGDISFPNITEADIQDKSKANGLSKIIVATQSLWFIVQCIGRLARGLSLAPLEVTTLAVTACTFMLSIIWWHKPFDVRQPIRLDIKHVISSDREASNEEYDDRIYLERPNDEVSGREGGSRLETINSLRIRVHWY
ncbi:hypothetical protein BDQ17DRAFT_1354839 [Cyathus striatus]|nr:hypothetical protein BDQ17DRAFT_1354839 [Cyathus striatus]